MLRPFLFRLNCVSTVWLDFLVHKLIPQQTNEGFNQIRIIIVKTVANFWGWINLNRTTVISYFLWFPSVYNNYYFAKYHPHYLPYSVPVCMWVREMAGCSTLVLSVCALQQRFCVILRETVWLFPDKNVPIIEWNEPSMYNTTYCIQ